MDNKANLVKYRIEQAEQCLKISKTCVDFDDYKAAANRSYYCVFNAIRSLLALDRVDFKKHKGVMNYFREKYIKTRIFDDKLSDILLELFEIRGSSDYDDFYIVSKEEVTKQIANAEYFLEQIKEYLGNKSEE